MKENSLKKRYVVKLLASIVNAIIGAIIIAIVPKALGPVAYGQFIFLQKFYSNLIGFWDMGSSLAFFTKLSARNNRKELISFYFLYSFIVFIIVLGLVIFCLYFNFKEFIIPDISSKYVILAFFVGFFTWITNIFIKISDAYALTVSVELIKIAHKIISLAILFFVIYQLSFDLELYYYYQYFIVSFFLVVVLILFVRKRIFSTSLLIIRDIKFKELIKEFLSYCHPLVVYSILSIIVGFLDIWLLQKVSGSEQTGFYGLAFALASMCFLFTKSMTSLITREFSKSYAEIDLRNMRKLFFRYIPMLYSIAAYFSVFIAFQSENVLTIFTDEKFKNAYLALVILSFYPIHQTYGQLSGSIFHATGKTALYRNIALFTQPLGLLISFVLLYIYEFGATGLATKMVIIQFIGINIQLYFNAKLLRFNMKYFLWHQMYSVLFFSLIALISTKFTSFESSLIEFLISGVIYTLLTIIFTYIFPQVFATNRKEIKENFLRFRQNVIKK